MYSFKKFDYIYDNLNTNLSYFNLAKNDIFLKIIKENI